MSIIRDMKKYMLQIYNPVRSDSGAPIENWTDVDYISVAVYKNDEFKIFATEKYLKSTHIGLTYSRNIEAEKYRLLCNSITYNVTSSNEDGRFTVLLLERVTDNAG